MSGFDQASRFVPRITSTVACDMDLTKYPMDEQECMLDLESCELELILNVNLFLPTFIFMG